MKNYPFLFFIFFLIANAAVGQNLVPNPGFEEYYPCDYNKPAGPSYFCGTWDCVEGMILDYYAITPKALSAFYWRIATGTHVGYKNDCNVESLRNAARTPALWYKPRTGKGFVILQTCAQYPYDGEFKSIRNYISVKLTSPLEAGCKYKVSFSPN